MLKNADLRTCRWFSFAATGGNIRNDVPTCYTDLGIVISMAILQEINAHVSRSIVFS